MAAPVRQRLLTSTIDLLRRHGVHGTGIADVLRESGVARQSIYHHFPDGKDELVAAATQAAGEHVRRVAQGGHVDALLAWWERTLIEHDYDIGCPVAAAALAGPDCPASTRAAREVFATWREDLASALRLDGVADPELLAGVLVSAFEGAIMQARVERSVTPLRDVAIVMGRLIVPE
ncbi:hypothetical protein BHE97_00955 [Aeromicrobium sp. PE09-221]|uniref:TetR/AcrR family transcriptional regulator n=1 Tax=Aeromicrobium sp. PE09-221 TaxID=1898043 RepID=UPI000B3E5226|nr:TetR/AcrR family transcriptional regulator [Aeromicrobium sp. PE09-221]OUZ12809.1 hypothetical protein BHE97_00955 [Aeromicrobium sp. PE09-221]